MSLATSFPLNISVEYANSNYGVYLKSGVSLSPLSEEIQFTVQKAKDVVGAIATYQLKLEIHSTRQEKLTSNHGSEEKQYAKNAQEALNAAIVAMHNTFAEAGFCDLRFRDVRKIEEIVMDQDPLYQVLLAKESEEKRKDPKIQQMIQNLVTEFRDTGLYDTALEDFTKKAGSEKKSP